jgi:hypothetical protein
VGLKTYQARTQAAGVVGSRRRWPKGFEGFCRRPGVGARLARGHLEA